MRSCILLIALSLYSVNAGALNSLFSFEDDYTGTAVLTFLKLPIGARSVAMGGNIAPIEEQAFALFTNPAAMALQSGVNTSISHTEMLGEFRHEVVAGSFAVPWNGRVGIGFNGLFTTPFTNSRSIEEEKSDFKAQDFAFSAGWATSLWHDRIQLGTRVNYLKSQIHTTIGQGYSFDWGLMNRLLWGFKSSVVLQNVSQGFSYGHVQEKLPTTMSLGLGWGDYTTPFSVTIGYSKSNDGLNYFNGGWEQHLGEYINLRLGYRKSLHDNELSWYNGMSGGAGIQLSSFSLDYGFRSLGELGGYHTFSFGFAPEQQAAKKDPRLLASRAYEQGNCQQAQKLANQILRRSPADLEMLAIVQQCAKEQDVQSGKAIRIYVGGNINGVLTPQLVNQSELGGMDRMAGFMQQMKNKYANVFVLDIGNPFGTTTSKPEYDIIHQAYKTMGHDAVFLSAKDRAGWLQFVQAPPTLNWLRTGLYAKGQLPLTQEYTFANKQLQVKVVAVGGLGGAGSLPDTINPVGAYANILKEQHASWSSHPSAVIAIVEGSPMLAEALANQLTFVDIIIVTGEKAGPPMVVRSGKTAIFSVGTGGTHIGKITILADQGDQADLANLANSIHTIRPSFEWIPMDRTVASHKEIFAKQQALYHSSVEKNNMQFINKHTFEDFLTLHAADSGGRQDIWYHPVEGKAFRATKSPLWIQSAGVAWSRDRLFYVGRSNPSDPNRIYIQNTKQKTAHAIGDSLLDVRKGQWGAFENWIYFTAFDSLKNAALYRVAASGSHQQIVSPAEWSDCYDFSLSYKGAFIAMVKGSPLHSDVYHTALGAPVPVQVTNGLVRVKNVEYSYDEKYLAFLSAPKLQKQNDIGQKDVWELTIWDIEKDTILTPLPGRSINDFIWGVDNRSIVFNDGVNVQDIRTYHLDTKQEVSIYSARGESVRNEDQPRVQFYKSQPGILFRLRNEQGTSIQWYNWQTKQIVPRTLLQQSTGLTLP